MRPFVVDASVVIKWLPPFRAEALAPEALILLEQWGRRSIDLVAPDLLWTEVANAHCRAVRQKRVTEDNAKISLAALHGHAIPTVPSEPLIDQALEIALLYGRTAYDSLYVALASMLKAELITADEKLVNALASDFPVKWLGAI